MASNVTARKIFTMTNNQGLMRIRNGETKNLLVVIMTIVGIPEGCTVANIYRLGERSWVSDNLIYFV